MSANEAFAQNLIKGGMAMIQEELRSGQNAEELQNKLTLGGLISGEILPRIKAGSIKGKDISLAINEAAGEAGVDPLEAFQIYNSMFKAAEEVGVDIGEQLDNQLKRQRLEAGERQVGKEARQAVIEGQQFEERAVDIGRKKTKLAGELQTGPEKTIAKIREEEAGITSADLKRIWNVGNAAEDLNDPDNLEDLAEELEDLYEGADLQDARDPQELISLLSNHIFSNDIEGFRGYEEPEIRQVLQDLILKPADNSPSAALKALNRSIVGPLEGEAFVRFASKLGG